MFQKHLANVS